MTRNIYREAAKRIASKVNKFTCLAIKDALGVTEVYPYDQLPEVRLYADYFNDADNLHEFAGEVGKPTNTTQCLRVLMLCLMADIIENP